MATSIQLGLVKEFDEFKSFEGLNVTDYDFNLDEYILKLSRILFPLDKDL
jgi:hypothetical protein